MKHSSYTCVAGLDLSLTNAGVAIIDGDLNAKYFSFGYSLSKKATHRDMLERVIFIANNIVKTLKENQVKYVGIENYAFRGNKLNLQADLGGVVKSQLYIMRIMPILLAANMIRKYVCGNAPRGARVKKIVKEKLLSFGYPEPRNLDESDALAVAHVINDYVNKRDRISDLYKIEVINNIDFNLRKGV